MKAIRSAHRQRGSEVVEFAISASLLFILLFGIIEFSVALFDKATLTNASREGARTGILFRPEPRDSANENAAIEQAIRNYAEQYLISLGGPASMTIDIQRIDRNSNGRFDAGTRSWSASTTPTSSCCCPVSSAPWATCSNSMPPP